MNNLISNHSYPTWRTVFRMLLSLKRDRPIIVALDEFQYLAEGEAGLREVASEFNAVWEAPCTLAATQ